MEVVLNISSDKPTMHGSRSDMSVIDTTHDLGIFITGPALGYPNNPIPQAKSTSLYFDMLTE
jgi:hypothetical protein